MARKANNRKKKTAKGRSKPRAVALTITGAKLKGPRFPTPDRVNTPAQESASSSQQPRPVQPYETMLRWSPWCLMLRQQAILAQGLVLLIGAQRQFVENCRLLSRPAARAKAMMVDVR
jgi:hypothetical protein